MAAYHVPVCSTKQDLQVIKNNKPGYYKMLDHGLNGYSTVSRLTRQLTGVPASYATTFAK